MKQLILISLITVMTSCGSELSQESQNKTYDITYTDGSHEIVISEDDINFSKGDCVESCGCSSETIKRCGVRKIEEITNAKVIPMAEKTATKDSVKIHSLNKNEKHEIKQ